MVERKVNLKAYLASEPGAGDVAAAEERESYTHELGELVCASRKRLQLVFAKATVGTDRGIELGAESEAGGEVMLQREATGVNVAASGLDTEDAGAGVAGEQKSEVGVEPRFVRDRFLRDGIEPVVSESRAKFLAGIAGWKFNVETCGEVGSAQGALGLVEIPL